MGEERRFHLSAEWNAIVERLKLTPCPYCKVVGTLNRHGSLHGYDESSTQPTLRARRVFCSNRNARRGCGRTISVWLADKIRRLSVTTGCLWKFLQGAVADGIAAAIRAATAATRQMDSQGAGDDGIAAAIRAIGCQRSARTWQRFDRGQSNIRTALHRWCSLFKLPADSSQLVAAETLAHLQAAFPNAACPIAAFQHTLQTFFV